MFIRLTWSRSDVSVTLHSSLLSQSPGINVQNVITLNIYMLPGSWSCQQPFMASLWLNGAVVNASHL